MTQWHKIDPVGFNKYLKERSDKLIAEMKILLGGKCVRCFANNDLQFDHVDRNTKEFEISRARSVSRARLLAEVRKCQLLCRKCHDDKGIKSGDILAPAIHGSKAMYGYHRCRCNICVEAHRQYYKDYWLKNRTVLNKRRNERRRKAKLVV